MLSDLNLHLASFHFGLNPDLMILTSKSNDRFSGSSSCNTKISDDTQRRHANISLQKSSFKNADPQPRVTKMEQTQQQVEPYEAVTQTTLSEKKTWIKSSKVFTFFAEMKHFALARRLFRRLLAVVTGERWVALWCETKVSRGVNHIYHLLMSRYIFLRVSSHVWLAHAHEQSMHSDILQWSLFCRVLKITCNRRCPQSCQIYSLQWSYLFEGFQTPC